MNSGTKVHDMTSGNEYDLIRNAVLGSRQDGRRYSGHVSEYGIIKTASEISDESLLSIKVSDVYDLIGSNANTNKIFGDKYLSDLLESQNEVEQKLGASIIQSYTSFMTMKGVSESLGKGADLIKGGLEKLLGEEQKK